MASLARAHGNSKVFYAGKEVALTSLSKNNMTQDELDQALAFIQ